MWRQNYGLTRRQLRQGSGTDVGSEHINELLGSSELCIYLSPSKKAKGYPELVQYLESLGCEVEFPADSPQRPGESYKVVKITYKREEVIPAPAIKRAHWWAHQRNFLHSNFKPLYQIKKTP